MKTLPTPAHRARHAARILLLAIALVVPALAPAAALGAPTMSARIQPSVLTLGQDARLVVTISGASNAATPRPVAVDGLQMQSLGQTMSMQFVNGSMTTEVTHTFLVRPNRTGDFQIPAISITVGSNTLSTRPLVLRVVDTSRVPQVKRTRPQATKPSAERAPDPTTGEDGQPSVALLEVAGLPDRKLFVGEVVPVEIRLYIREGTRVTEATPPSLVGSGFTLSRPAGDEPRQQRVRLSGNGYTRLTFPAALSPITAGELPLQATLDITARIPKRVPRQRRRFDDPFFDSFFDSFAYSAVDQKVPVASKPTTVRVAPLPANDRPEIFTGGVGQFSMSASAEPTTVAVGDPITLKVVLSGTGNFDRLQLPGIVETEEWKTYDPTSQFAAEDDLGLTGKKTFEQALLPLRADLSEVPARKLTYFDPERREYVGLSIDAIPIEVRAAPAGHRPLPIGSGAVSGLDAYELAPNKIDLGALHANLRPAATRPTFLLVQLLPLVAVCAAFWWGGRRRRLALDPAHLRSKRIRGELKVLIQRMDAGVASGDSVAFFEAARRAIQERVAGIDGAVAAQSLTLAEIERTLRDRPELCERVRGVFCAADALAYGGSDDEARALAGHRNDVVALLQELDREKTS
ncbi:MAG: BatD family protein [Candidatus Binatia bacterium]|nr:BatD family protein [Candidatus Binatia bacterium]